jgi:ankyrin repeat protein
VTTEELIQFVYRRDHEAIAAAVRSGADINARDRDDRTPLMHAVLASEPDAQLVVFLISLGANAGAQEARGQRWSVLHFAARDHALELVRILLSAGACVDPLDSFGNTPLWRATMGVKEDLRVVKLLLSHGADPSKANMTGVSPRALAERLGRSDLLSLMDARS